MDTALFGLVLAMGSLFATIVVFELVEKWLTARK
jgi:hypothetical protein